MKRESVLILGAGLMQKPAIKAAKKNGYKTFVIDGNTLAQSIRFADVFKNIDLKNRDEILEYAIDLKNKENLKAVFTAGTDFSASVSYVTEKLGFNAHSFDSALNASIKSRMRACFEKSNIPSPKYYTFSSEMITEEDYERDGKIYEAIKTLGFPCVVKPTDNMGARGCRMIRSEFEMKSSIKVAIENSRTGTIILEQYMEGPEYSIDALIYDGTMTITGFADRHIYFPPYFIETGHTMPSIADEQVKKELISVFALGAKALGLTCGAAKADIKYTKDGPEIGEIAARLSGGYMSGWTFPYSSSLNLTEQALLIACGKEPRKMLKMRTPLDFTLPESLKEEKLKEPYKLFQVESSKVSAERAWISIPGKIKEVKGLNKKVIQSCVKNIFPRPVKNGMEVDFPRNNVQKCGNVISKSKKYRKAILASEKKCSNVFIRLEPNNSRTENFINNIQMEDEIGFPPVAFNSYYKILKMKLEGNIPSNEPVLKNIPIEILPLLEENQMDWNYLTIKQTLKRFDKICKIHPVISQKQFWLSVFKGGLQAAVYISDSSFKNNKVE